MTPCPTRRLVDRHFAGRISTERERDLRTHLPDCVDCRRYYERHLLVAKLDSRALPAEKRLALALGLGSAGSSFDFARWSNRALVLASAAAVSAALLLFVRARQERASEFQARGVAVEPRIWAYRIESNGGSSALGDVMGRADELAFAYDNPSRAARLLVFGVDEHRHVYWYHPAWLDAASTPVAVAIEPGRHELSEAIAHDLDGSELTLYAVFTNEAVTVHAVEQAVVRGDARFTSAAAWTQRVRVAR